MTNIELTLDAERGLVDIYLYGIEHFGQAQAERYAETHNGKMAVAADNPSFGADYSFVRNVLRRYECVSQGIYYRASASGILVPRSLNGRMDPGQHLT